MYVERRGRFIYSETLPPKFFYVLSSFGSFCYMKTPSAELKRMVAPDDIQTGVIDKVGADLKAFEHVNYCLAVRKK